VTLDRVIPDHAQGHFTYHYANGDELTCTFDVPDRPFVEPSHSDDDIHGP
jgi:hypothetical protein